MPASRRATLTTAALGTAASLLLVAAAPTPPDLYRPAAATKPIYRIPGGARRLDQRHTQLVHFAGAAVQQAFTGVTTTLGQIASGIGTALKQIGSAIKQYDQTQRAADQQLVASSGANKTQDVRDAEARLRDYATATNPGATTEARTYAGERLDDYNKSQIQGPLPKDPVTGDTIATRAQGRLAAQKLAETKLGYSADQATKAVDQAEKKVRPMIISRLEKELQSEGMSPEGAKQFAEGVEHGKVPEEYLKMVGDTSHTLDASKDGFKEFVEKSETNGRHWAAGETYSAEDLEAIKKLGTKIGHIGSALEIAKAAYEIANGESVGKVAAQTAGGMGGAYISGEAGGFIGGALGGPPGALIGALVLGTAGGIMGDEWAGEVFDSVSGEG